MRNLLILLIGILLCMIVTIVFNLVEYYLGIPIRIFTEIVIIIILLMIIVKDLDE